MKKLKFLLFITLLLPFLLFTSCKETMEYNQVIKEMNKDIVLDEEYAKEYSKTLKIFSSDSTSIYLYASNANEAKSFSVFAIIDEEVRKKTLFYTFNDTASKDTHITGTVKYGKGSMLDAYSNSSYYSQMYLDASFSISPAFTLDDGLSFASFNKDSSINIEKSTCEAEMLVLLDLSLKELSAYMKANGLSPADLGITKY